MLYVCCLLVAETLIIFRRTPLNTFGNGPFHILAVVREDVEFGMQSLGYYAF